MAVDRIQRNGRQVDKPRQPAAGAAARDAGSRENKPRQGRRQARSSNRYQVGGAEGGAQSGVVGRVVEIQGPSQLQEEPGQYGSDGGTPAEGGRRAGMEMDEDGGDDAARNAERCERRPVTFEPGARRVRCVQRPPSSAPISKCLRM